MSTSRASRSSSACADAELPEGVDAELGPLATPIGEIYRYTLDGRGARSDDAAHAAGLGGAARAAAGRRASPTSSATAAWSSEIHVAARSPRGWRRSALTLEDLEKALRKASANASRRRRRARRRAVRDPQRRASSRRSRTSARTRVATRDGTPVRVADVASVSEGWAPRQGVVSRGDEPRRRRGHRAHAPRREPVGGARALARRDRRSSTSTLPARSGTVEIEPFYDRTELVDTTLETVGHNLLEGASLVMLVLFVFLLDLRAALIVGDAHPAVAAVGVHLPALARA